MLACATMVPWNVEPAPSDAELPTAQNTLLGSAPLINMTDETAAVVSVLAILKAQTELGSFWPSSVRIPVI